MDWPTIWFFLLQTPVKFIFQAKVFRLECLELFLATGYYNNCQLMIYLCHFISVLRPLPTPNCAHNCSGGNVIKTYWSGQQLAPHHHHNFYHLSFEDLQHNSYHHNWHLHHHNFKYLHFLHSLWWSTYTQTTIITTSASHCCLARDLKYLFSCKEDLKLVYPQFMKLVKRANWCEPMIKISILLLLKMLNCKFAWISDPPAK